MLTGEIQARTTTLKILSREILFKTMGLDDINTEMSINEDTRSLRTELSSIPTDRSKIDGGKPAKEEG